MRTGNKLRRGLQVWRLTGRTIPALLAFALMSLPVDDALAEKPDDSYVYGETMIGSFDAVENRQDDLGQSDMSMADLSPTARKFLMTVQLAQADEEDVNDPLEGFNRAIFSFNEGFYNVVMRPVSSAYNTLPSNIRMMINSFLVNLSSPIVFINDVLQGEFERAMTTAGRFVVNSTFGFAGVADVASSMGLERHNEDFGQTLAVWGAGEGFYLVLPILGPSNPRDAIGRFIVDPLIDPVNYRLDETGNEDWIWGRFALSAVDQYASIRDELDQIKKTSVDYYAAIRSLYRQKRKAEIANGEEMDLPPIPDFEFGVTDPHPVLGGNQKEEKNDDQLSQRAFDRDTEEKILQNPFEARFVPALGAREIADLGDSMRPAPRKPAEYDWVRTPSSSMEEDKLVAEMSWQPVISTPR